MALKGILFDLDGTLANTLPVCVLAYQATVEHFSGWTPTEEEVYAQFGPADEGMLETFIPGRLDETLPYFLQAYERFHDQCLQPFPGIERALSILEERGIRMAIVTGKGPHSAAISLRILELNRWFDIVETGFAKALNKSYSIRQVLQRWGLSPAEAAYVGDMPSDMQASCEVGVLALGAAWASTSVLQQATDVQADAIFRDIDSFVQWIEQC